MQPRPPSHLPALISQLTSQARCTRRLLLSAAGLVTWQLVTAAPASAATAQPTPRVVECPVLTFHETSYDAVFSTVRGYLEAGYFPLTIERLVMSIQGVPGVVEHLPPRPFCITADDGLRSQLEMVRALADLGRLRGAPVEATLFILTKFDDLDLPVARMPGNTPCYRDGVHQYLTVDDLRWVLSNRHRLESHTVNHASLPALRRRDPGAWEAEIAVSRKRVEAVGRLEVPAYQAAALAYPMGRSDPETEALVARYFRAGFTTAPGTIQSPGDLMHLHRGVAAARSAQPGGASWPGAQPGAAPPADTPDQPMEPSPDTPVGTVQEF